MDRIGVFGSDINESAAVFPRDSSFLHVVCQRWAFWFTEPAAAAEIRCARREFRCHVFVPYTICRFARSFLCLVRCVLIRSSSFCVSEGDELSFVLYRVWWITRQMFHPNLHVPSVHNANIFENFVIFLLSVQICPSNAFIHKSLEIDVIWRPYPSS